MSERLKDKVAIVTGSGRGIGRAHALALAAEGAKLVVNDLGGAVDGTGADKGPADEVVAEIKKKGGTAVANYDSVTSHQGGENIIKTALDNFGQLDILVNNAGILRERMIFNMTDEEWDGVMKVHLYGHFNTTKFACIYFRQRWKEQQKGGRIINTSSVAGLGGTGQANYCAAKEGIVGFTRAIAREMGRYGVTCNAIRPGAGTRMTMSEEVKASWERLKSQGRFAGPPGAMGAGLGAGMGGLTEPEDVSPMVVYLCTDDAADINGCTFDAYGGTIALYSEPVPIRTIQKEGRWTLDELMRLIPSTIAQGLVNPAQPELPKG